MTRFFVAKENGSLVCGPFLDNEYAQQVADDYSGSWFWGACHVEEREVKYKYKWYMGVFEGDEENAYERFDSDEAAIRGFRTFIYGFNVLEIYECANDETLTPVRQVM